MTTTEALTIRLVWPHEGGESDLASIQGIWTEAQYLKISDQTNVLIEFTDGEIEVLAMPTRNHQAIILFLVLELLAVVKPRGGVVYFSPLRMQIRPGKYREPDLLLLLDALDPRNQEAFWLGADLVMEVVSPDNPERDTVTKRADYAEAGIAEYWIVNPFDETITVLALVEGAYITHGSFRRGEQATSNLLNELSVAVGAVFDAL